MIVVGSSITKFSEEELEARRIEREYKRSWMPKQFRGVDLSAVHVDDRNRDAVRAAKRWISGMPWRAPMITGPAGMAKTMIACAMGNAVIAKRGMVRFVTPTMMTSIYSDHRDMTSLIQKVDHLDEDSEPYQFIMAFHKWTVDLRTADLVILDDLGSEYRASGSGWAGHLAETLLRDRGRLMRPTVITSNLRVERFRERYGEPFFSYLHEISEFVTVEGPDWRVDAGE